MASPPPHHLPARSEVDAHHDASYGGTAHLMEAGGGERPLRTDVELLQERGVRRHRIALDGARAALAGEIHRGAGEGAADAPPAEADARHEAGDRPHAVVVLVLVPALPRHAERADQADVGAAGLHRAPAGRLAVDVGDEAARRRRPGCAAARLLAQPVRALLDREGAKRLPRPQLVALALTERRRAARAEDGLQVVAARLVGGHDRDARELW